MTTTFQPLTRHDADRELIAATRRDSIDQVTGKDFVELVDDPNPAVRVIAARNIHTPKELISHLALDRNVNVRAGVAANPQATGADLAAVIEPEGRPAAKLRALVSKSIARNYLLGAVSTHRNTSEDTLVEVRRIAGVQATPGRYANERLTLLRLAKTPA